MLRLNLGCGPTPAPGWWNCDAHPYPAPGGIDHVGKVENGLPLRDGQADYAVSNHVLQMVGWAELVPHLAEVRRVVRRGGALRVLVPDVVRAFAARSARDAAWFPIADHHESDVDGKFCMYVTQAGATRSIFTIDYLTDLLHRAGWSQVAWPQYGVTRTPHPGIVELDSREHESLIVEAM